MSDPRPWDSLIGPEEVAIYERAGFLREVAIGERPVLLLIDVQYKFCGEFAEPVRDAVQHFRFSCGEHAWQSIPHIQELLGIARAKGIPVIYTHDQELVPDPTPEEQARGTAIVEEVAPLTGDPVIDKEGYSGFFGTRLISLLTSLGVDTVIVAGGTTSGCVRATVTDAYDYRFRVFVVQECVFDRAVIPHAVNLFDIAAKAANVVSLERMTELLSPHDYHGAFATVGDSPTWRFDRE
jgi:nicotinamidase-related amidase